MGGTLSFKIEDVKKVLNASSKEFMLVGDQGVYLCSDIVDPATNKRVVTYAKGINPEVDKFDTWYERKRRIFGGDDGVEAFPVQHFKDMMAKADQEGFKTLKIKLTTTSMKFMMEG